MVLRPSKETSSRRRGHPDPFDVRRFAALAVLLAVSSGCRGTTRGMLADVRLDWNRYRDCTFRIERRSHLPSRTDHIRYMRWLHGEEPVFPYCEEKALKGPDHHRVAVER